jgi:CRP/FNR family transcriptional regulator, cyclic AMP receptor protein
MSKQRVIGVFGGLSEADVKLLTERGQILRLRAGQEHIEEGQPQGHLFVVLSGRVHAGQRAPNGAQRYLGLVEAGETYGEVTLFDAKPASASIKAGPASEVLLIPRSVFFQFLCDFPAAGCTLLLNLCQTMAQRLRGANERLGQEPTHNLDL